jgi:uncharacterized membrane protein
MDTHVMEPLFGQLMAWVTVLLELMGVLVIVIGILIATVSFIRMYRHKHKDLVDNYRRRMGHAILLGLEFLVAADIVNTVTTNLTYDHLGLLAILVLIRTFLSFTIELEVEGRWPWQKLKAAKS